VLQKSKVSQCEKLLRAVKQKKTVVLGLLRGWFHSFLGRSLGNGGISLSSRLRNSLVDDLGFTLGDDGINLGSRVSGSLGDDLGFTLGDGGVVFGTSLGDDLGVTIGSRLRSSLGDDLGFSMTGASSLAAGSAAASALSLEAPLASTAIFLASG
jgi:hypothetical protein